MSQAKRQGFKNIRDRRERRSFWIGFWGLIATILAAGYSAIAPEASPWIGVGLFALALVLVLLAGLEYPKAKLSTKIIVASILIVIFVASTCYWITRATAPAFVFVKPGIWLNDDRWLMLVQHSGFKSVYNIEILFSDEDRLSAFKMNPNDINLIKDANRKLHFDEIDPKGTVTAQSFQWQPLNPDYQHYSATISTRDKRLMEILDIERINGNWKYAMKLEDEENNTFVFCKDAEFPESYRWPESLKPCFPDFKAK
jgi:hypothetical protein